MPTETKPNPAGKVRTQIIKDAARYVPSSYLAQVLGMVNGFVMRFFLGPTQMGVWSTVQMIVGYGSYFYMGSTAAGAKEIPYQRAKKDPQSVAQVKNTIFVLNVLVSLGLAVALALAGWLSKGLLADNVRACLLGAGVFLIVQRFYTFYVMLLRGYNDFTLLSKLVVLTAVLDLGLTLGLIAMFKIYGLFAALVLSMGISVFYVRRRFPQKVSFAMDRKMLWRVSGIGLPLLVYGLLFTFLRTLDKLTILKFMSVTELGIYSIPMMASNYCLGFAAMIAIVLLPKFSGKFAKGQDIREVGSYLLQSTEVIAYTVPSMLAVLYFVAPVLVRLLLKEYVAGIPAMQILLFGSFFLTLVHQPNTFLLSIDKQVLMVPACILGILSAGVLLWMAGTMFHTLEAVAIAISLGYAVYLAVLMGICLLRFLTAKRALAYAGNLLLPFGYSLGVVLLADAFIRMPSQGWQVGVQILATLASALLPLWAINRKSGVLRHAWAIVRERITRSKGATA